MLLEEYHSLASEEVKRDKYNNVMFYHMPYSNLPIFGPTTKVWTFKVYI
jgi:hypothetical protein